MDEIILVVSIVSGLLSTCAALGAPILASKLEFRRKEAQENLMKRRTLVEDFIQVASSYVDETFTTERIISSLEQRKGLLYYYCTDEQIACMQRFTDSIAAQTSTYQRRDLYLAMCLELSNTDPKPKVKKPKNRNATH